MTDVGVVSHDPDNGVAWSGNAFTVSRKQRFGLGVLSLLVLAILGFAPLLGWFRVVRLSPVVAGASLLALAILRPWRQPGAARRLSVWEPSRRAVTIGAAGGALLLFWCVLTRFYSGQINAIDFTVYYDRPCYQTVIGNPLFVEVSDSPGHSFRSELADHAYWVMLPICSLYAIKASPLWLHLIPALAVAGGAVFVLRVLKAVSVPGIIASAAAAAFVLNDNTARALNYGFHPEVLYMLFVPWIIDAALRGARLSFLVAVCGCVLVKESAFLPLFAASTAVGLHRGRTMGRGDRVLFLLFPTLLALANVGFYYAFVVPLLTGETRPAYAHFWGNYGSAPHWALVGMLRDPFRVLADVRGSGIGKVLAPFLMVLPLLGWRFVIGLLPIVLIFGASANDQVRDFGIYYALPLVPCLVLGAAEGVTRSLGFWKRLGPAQGRVAAAAVLLAGAVLVGGTHRGYSLRPWRAELPVVPEALSLFADEPVILVQSGLFPHAGYDSRFRLLTPESLHAPGNATAVVLLGSGLSAYPFGAKVPRHDAHLAALLATPSLRPLPAGLHAVRVSALGSP